MVVMKKYHCIESNCNNQVERHSFYRKGRCKPCAFKGKKNSGLNAPFYSKKHSLKTKFLMRKKALGRKPSKEICKKISINRKGKAKGENNPNWKGGISKLPYSFKFNDELKLAIRMRDDYQCQNCDMTEAEHLIVYGKVLIIHHIDYDKMNCKEENLITMCIQCNSRVNFNRDYWTEFFKQKMEVTK